MPVYVSQADLERSVWPPDVSADSSRSPPKMRCNSFSGVARVACNAVLDRASAKTHGCWNYLVVEEPARFDVDDLETALKIPLSRLSFTAVDGDKIR